MKFLLKKRRLIIKLLLLIPAAYICLTILQNFSEPSLQIQQQEFQEIKLEKRKNPRAVVIEKPIEINPVELPEIKKLRDIDEEKAFIGLEKAMHDDSVDIMDKQKKIFGEPDQMLGHEEKWKANEDNEAVKSLIVHDAETPEQLHKIRDEERKQIPQVPEVNFDKNAPGEMGRAVKIDRAQLTDDQKKLYDQGWKNNAYNQYAADMISLHRSLPDVRDPECKKLTYQDDLPDTSVIICFHNEAWSVLLRTVHSVLDRSPEHLIKEIILVDDFSNMEHLKQRLDEYVAALGKVKIIRTSKREGLIRARLIGAKNAEGKVLTFLDSHCECAEGWLTPQLERIGLNSKTVTCPVIDVIDDANFKFLYSGARQTNVGGFDWGLQFNWHSVPDRQLAGRNSDVLALRSPTMAGGLFSIDKAYFEKLGTYDSGMDIWGGENLELSFKIWMCGGTLEILPCSHVGHVFRKRSPYSWGEGGNVLKRNSIRVAEVWMDDYKKYYYERINFNLGNFGDVSARKELRKALGCKSFDWYVKNIYPELFIPGEALYSGEIRSKVPHGSGVCLDSSVEQLGADGVTLKTWPCHKQGGNQFWMMSKTNEIRRDEGCFDYASHIGIKVMSCHSQKGNQMWMFTTNGSIRHVPTDKCLQLEADFKTLKMTTCSDTNISQHWIWRANNPVSHTSPV